MIGQHHSSGLCHSKMKASRYPLPLVVVGMLMVVMVLAFSLGVRPMVLMIRPPLTSIPLLGSLPVHITTILPPILTHLALLLVAISIATILEPFSCSA